MTDDVRTRILRAAVTCVGRYGLSKTSLEDVAREADVGRATVYRYFEGGRDQLLAETISFEVTTFFRRLALEVDDTPDFPTRMEKGLLFAHRAVLEHEVLQKVLDTEPERLLPHLTHRGAAHPAGARRVPRAAAASTWSCGRASPRSPAADWLARMVLSFIIGQGSWDLGDPDEVHRLVNDHLLVGVLAPA